MRKESSSNTINDNHIASSCNAHKTLALFSGRWKLSILFLLDDASCSYSEIKNALGSITDRILAKQLHELVSTGIVTNDKSKTSSRYFLTEKGKRVIPILWALRTFQ